MSKQSIREFFRPSTKALFLRLVLVGLVLIMLLTTGVPAIKAVVVFAIGWPMVVFQISHNWKDTAVIFSTVAWLSLFLYVICCLLIFIFRKACNRKNFGTTPALVIKMSLRSIFITLINILIIVTVAISIIYFVVSSTTAIVHGNLHRNARIYSGLSQMSIDIRFYKGFYEVDNFDNFACDFDESKKTLCREIDRNYGEIDGKEPIIVLNSKINSSAVCVYSPLYPKRKQGWVDWLKEAVFGQEKTWFCIDSVGARGETKIDPGSSGYCVDGQSAKCPPITGD